MKLLLLLVFLSCSSKEEKKTCDNGAVAPECTNCPKDQVMGKGRCIFRNTGTPVDESKWVPLKGL